jgi:hypothetical protein
MRKVRIVTHNGTAHRDDFLACCAILFHEYADRLVQPVIERRMVTEADLSDSHTYVIDTGGKWCPELLNFDHHQAAANVAERCALDMVLEHIMGADTYKGFCRANEWLRLTTVQDTRGSSEAALYAGVTPHAYAVMRSPVELYILRWFSEAAIVHADSALYAAMREIGRSLLASVPDVRAQLNSLRSIPGPVDVDGVLLWDIRPAWDSDERHSFAIVNDMASKMAVDIVVGHNLRHNKVGLYRQEWAASRLNLSRLEGHPKFHSAHQNGFYAVVSGDVKDFELVEMVSLARTS